ASEANRRAEWNRTRCRSSRCSRSGAPSGSAGWPTRRGTRPRLAPPVGRIAVGRNQQRDVIVGVVGDRKADRDHVEERRIGELCALLAKIIADMKGQLVLTGLERRTVQQRVV